jgi:hypothetical protein
MDDKWMWIAIMVITIMANVGFCLSDSTKSHKEIELAKIDCERNRYDD